MEGLPGQRHVYSHAGKTVYEWDQSLSEVNIYVEVPQGVRAKQLTVSIKPQHLSVGIKDLPAYLDKELGGLVRVSESLWTLEDGVLHIQLAKAQADTTWASAIAGHELRADQQQEDQKRLLLERFQQEHPGFDFSSAEFSGMVLAVSVPERQTVTERTPPPPPPEVEVKVVGFGGRGAHALSKLVGHSQLAKAELWCLESDRAMLEGCPTSNTLLLPKDDASSSSPEGGMLSPADLASIVGRAASDAGGRGNMNAGTDGAITFVLAPAAAAPGGAATVLQVVGALRAAGHFTVAAVTQPFGFEGSGKREQAEELVAALKQAAHVVAVMEQDVLMQAFGSAQMTVAEATDIADTALEHTVLSILRAVQAEEVLKSSRGALMWHGRDLRHFKRILPPPVQQLLTRPGTAVLGRGLASMPAEAAHQMGAAQALMHLASDAVRAAAESPFLEGALLASSGVLVCIDLPPTAQQLYTGTGSAPQPLAGLETPEGERRVLQLSAQAAAGALGTLSGPSCQDYVLTAQPRAAPLGSDGSLLQVEATLLVMRCSDSELAGAPGGAAGLITRQMLLQQSGQQRYGVGPAVPPPPRQVRPPQRLPSSSWSMLSAVAGGKAAPPRPQQAGAKSTGQQQPPPQQVPAPQQQQQPQQPPRRVPSNLPNFFGGGASQQAQPGAKVGAKQQPGLSPANEQLQQQAAASRQEPQRLPVQQQAAQGSPTQPPAGLEQPAEQQRVVPTPPRVADAAVGQAAHEAAGDAELQPKATVGEYIVKASLKAQSLDLSPAAAQWRQEHRGDEFEQRKLIVWEVDDEPEPWQAEEESSLGLAALLPPGMRKEKKKVDIRARLANVLSQDREDAAWADGNVDSDA